MEIPCLSHFGKCGKGSRWSELKINLNLLYSSTILAIVIKAFKDNASFQKKRCFSGA